MSLTQGQRERIRTLVHKSVTDSLTSEEHDEFQSWLLKSPEARDEYFLQLDIEHGLRKLAFEQQELENSPGLPQRPSQGIRVYLAIAALAASIMVAIFVFSPPSQPSVATDNGASNDPTVETSTGIQLVEVDRARFFGESKRYAIGDALQAEHDYALSEGSVKIGFPIGAEVIIEAPSVFSIVSSESIQLKLGDCSVFAPPGAEGFRVITPRLEVVDQGTRFAISVSETGQSDVDVIEGAAELFSLDEQSSIVSDGLMLTAGERTIADPDGTVAKKMLPARSDQYRFKLQDRITDFTVLNEPPKQDVLTDVTVQRNGHKMTYSVDELIGIDLIHFRAGENPGNMSTVASYLDPPDNSNGLRRADLLDRDRILSTGTLNPGGSKRSLKTDPVIEGDSDALTPGFAVRFHQPVVNSAGPDVVLFDLHVVVHPEAGDPFHVSPLKFLPGLKSHTVRKFDISLEDRASRQLGGFRLYFFPGGVKSIDELSKPYQNTRLHQIPAKVIAVGIDLSDLGYAPGETVEGLFFQDSLDDDNYIDPVLIAGLPPLED